MIQRYFVMERVKDNTADGDMVLYTDHLAAMKEKEREWLEIATEEINKNGKLREDIATLAATMTTNKEAAMECGKFERDELLLQIAAKMKAYFIAAECQNVDELLLGSEEMYMEIGKVTAARIEAIITDRDTAMSMLEDAEGRVQRLTIEKDEYLKMLIGGEPPYYTRWKEVVAENSALREQNSMMNASLVKLRLENERLREALGS